MKTTAQRINVVAMSYGAWLAGMMFVQFLLSGGFVSVAIGFALLVVPVAMHMWLLGWRGGNSQQGALYFSLFFLTVFISLFANVHRLNAEVMVQLFALTSLVGIGYIIAQHQHHALLEKIFVWFAIFLALVLVIVLIDNDRLWARLMGRLHSNLWSAVCIAAIPGSLAIRNPAARLVTLGFVLYMVAFEFNARGPLLYCVSTVIAFVALWTVHNPSRAFTPRTQFAAVVAAFGLLLLLIVYWDFIATNILFLDSVSRGLSSGLTGRWDLWAHLIEIAARHPFTGVGFRMHDVFVNIPGLASAHNAYIAMLVDLGAPGLGLYLLLIATSLWRAILTQRRALIGAYLIGYALLGLTEARALNVGNPASILFIFSIMVSLSHRAPHASRSSSSAQRHGALPKAASA